MNKILLPLLFILCLSQSSWAGIARDTTIIEFSDTTVNKRVTVISTGDKEISLPLTLNLNSVLKAMGIDTTERENAIVLVGDAKNKRDTLFVLSQNGQRIEIISKGSIQGRSETSERRTYEGPDENYSNQNGNRQSWDKKEEDHKEEQPKKSRFFSKSDFGLYVGLNTLANEQAGPFTNEDLRTWKSRYVALSLRRNATLLRGIGADLALSYGPEVIWYNYMFQNSNSVEVRNNQPVYADLGFATEKTKLVVPALNFPVLLNLGIKKEKFKLGVGGYVGYRFGGYTKTKDTDGNKEKIKGDYKLTPLLYGLTAELGKRNGFTLFIRYDLNTLFDDQSNRPNAFSFGIRI